MLGVFKIFISFVKMKDQRKLHIAQVIKTDIVYN